MAKKEKLHLFQEGLIELDEELEIEEDEEEEE